LRYLLDTNIISAFAPKKKPIRIDEQFSQWFEAHTETFYLATISLVEIESGIHRLRRAGGERRADDLTVWLLRIVELYASRIIALDVAIAIAAGGIEARALANGRPPQLADVLVAATARVQGLIVLTRNLRHFEPLDVTALDPFKSFPEL
jgi:predicted nucleic acid-binding protein